LELPVPVEVKLDKKFPVFVDRDPMMTSLGCHVEGAALPHPDQNDPVTMLGGVFKRIAGRLPEPNRELLEKLSLYCDKWLEKHMVPLSDDDDLSFDTWIEKRPYPLWRKDQLRKKFEEMETYDFHEKYTKVKCFMKDECYTEYKHARGIYARDDRFKVLFGPLCSAIEDRLYKHESFIKHIPVADRPKYIKEFF
jgi:hypothetical protein